MYRVTGRDICVGYILPVTKYEYINYARRLDKDERRKTYIEKPLNVRMQPLTRHHLRQQMYVNYQLADGRKVVNTYKVDNVTKGHYINESK